MEERKNPYALEDDELDPVAGGICDCYMIYKCKNPACGKQINVYSPKDEPTVCPDCGGTSFSITGSMIFG